MNTPHKLHKTLAAAAMLAATTLTAFGLTLEGTFNGTTRYVSKSGSDANGGTSWDDAKLTIQAAVNLCADGDTVIVDDGEYSDTTTWTSVSDNTKTLPTVVQITKRIHLVSRNGKFKTHIVGQWANTSNGVGTGAHRCIYINGTASNADAARGTLIEGFTIREGATEASTAGNTDYDSAGGICGGTGNNGTGLAWVVDCDIVNCRAGTGAAMSRGIVPIRCAFVGNRGVKEDQTQHVFYRTLYAYNCVFAMNGPATRTVSTSGGSIFAQAQSATVVNCTFIDNTTYGFQPGGQYVTPIYNCAWLGDGEACSYGSGGNKAYLYPTNCVQTASGTDIGGRLAKLGSAAGDKTGVSATQFFLDAGTGEAVFLSGGDLKDAGYNARSVAETFVPEEYLDTDFFGNPRNWASVDIGAIEAQGDAVAAPETGYLQLGTNTAIRAASNTIELPRGLVASADGSAASVRVVPLVSGDARFLVTGSSSYTRIMDGRSDGGADLDLPASGKTDLVNLAAPAGVYYVDAVNGNDENDGLTAATAKKTLAATLPNAAPGSVVHAAPGDYDEGSQTYTAGTILVAPQNTHSPSRGWVRANVLLVADEGPDVTFITGAIDDSDGNGLGDGSIRCLTAGNGAVVRGFTLRNGGTFNTTGGARDENMGGLALTFSGRHGLTGTALFENCVFSNGYARTAGLVAGGIYRRCTFSGGHSTSGGNLSWYGRFEHCLLLNDAMNDTGIRYCAGMRSSTYVATKGKGNGANVELGDSLYNYGAAFENSILATANRTGGNAVTMKNMTNCLWVTGGGNATIDSTTCANVTTVATVDDALAMLDADYRPLAGSALVDAGDKSLLAKLADGGETDLAGGQRVYGGQIDIGAYEYDLRGDLSAALGGRVSAVGTASQDATLADGGVVLPEGEISATVSANEATSIVVPVQVTGAGTLSIYLGNSETPAVTVTAADGAQQPRLSFAAGDTAVRLVFDGAGSASIGRFAGADPFVLTIR